MRWWERLFFWRWLKRHRERMVREAAVESEFQKVFKDAEARRGDLKSAIEELKLDRQRRQTLGIDRPSIG